MGVCGDHVLPRLIDVACNMKESVPQRQRACEGLAGEVVEIGFGSGSNVPFYPAAVTRVAAVEPADVAWKLAPDEKVRHWQHRFEPMQKRLFGGCHLTRPAVELLQGAGFEVVQVDRYYEKGSPKIWGANSLG